MPAVDPGFTNPTGKNNLVTSFNKWLETNVPPADANDFAYDFLNDQDPQTYPQVTVFEVTDASPDTSAFGNVVFSQSEYPVVTPATEGKLAGITFQIDVETDGRRGEDAKRKMYKIRDRIRYALDNAGVTDDLTGVEKVPPILVLDYDNGAAKTGIIAQIPLDAGSITETFVTPEEGKPSIHTLSLTVRLEWFELN